MTLEESGLPPTLGDAARAGEPIYVIPPDERVPEIAWSASAFLAEFGEMVDWGHTNLGIAALHEQGIMGEGVIVAVLDTGCDVEHPAIKPNLADKPHKDFTGSISGIVDHVGHGTHVAGTIVEIMDGSNLRGIAPKAKLLVVKVLDDQGSGASSWIANGIRYAADQGAHVINMSLGGPGTDQQIRAACDYATNKGTLIFAAAGNDGREATNDPGHYDKVAGVAATDKLNKVASFSTRNLKNDCAAPGVQIKAPLPDNRWGQMSGTSMACPNATGCAALVVGEYLRRGLAPPSMSAMLSSIAQTSKDLGATGLDKEYGWGLIDPAALIALIPDLPPVPPEEPVCPVGHHWDAALGRCVPDEQPPPPPPGGGLVTKEELKKWMLTIAAVATTLGFTVVASTLTGLANSELALNTIMLVLRWIGLGAAGAMSTGALAALVVKDLTPAQKEELKAALK